MRNFLNETNDLHWLLVGVYKNTAYFCSFKFFVPQKEMQQPITFLKREWHVTGKRLIRLDYRKNLPDFICAS